MADQREESRTGYRALLTCASIVVVLWGLRWAAPILLPLLSAAFIAVICIPPMRRLERHGAPTWLALLLVLAAANVALMLVAAVIGRSVISFQANLGEYRARLDALVGDGIDWLNSLGADIQRADLLEKFDTAAVMTFAGDTAQSLVAAAGDGALIGLTVIFILFEASGFRDKLRLALGNNGDNLDAFKVATQSVHDYLAVKTLISVVNGIGVAILTWAVGVDFPLLWGLLAFLFNYIPNIGAFIAGIPPVLLALLQLGPVHAVAVAAGFLVFELVLGNFIEPKLLGNRLGLSTLVVWISLIFWNWVWGPVGMLLSVPLTVIVKILLENSTDFRAAAVLLGPNPAKPATVEEA